MSIYLTEKMPIVTEDNWRELLGEGDGDDRKFLIDGEVKSYGCKPRDHSQGQIEVCAAPDFELIPRNEWASRLKDIEQAGADLITFGRKAGIKVKDQNGTNYCHAFSPATCIEYARAIAGEQYVEMSAGSIGGPVTNYTNSGAWINQDLRHIIQKGCASTEFVPMRQIRRNGWKPGAEENALLHRVTHWYDMMSKRDGKMFERVMTQILLGRCVAFALNWMSHAMTYVHGVHLGGNRFALIAQNSWGEQDGDRGFRTFEEGRGTPDEAYVPFQATASLI